MVGTSKNDAATGGFVLSANEQKQAGNCHLKRFGQKHERKQKVNIQKKKNRNKKRM